MIRTEPVKAQVQQPVSSPEQPCDEPLQGWTEVETQTTRQVYLARPLTQGTPSGCRSDGEGWEAVRLVWSSGLVKHLKPATWEAEDTGRPIEGQVELTPTTVHRYVLPWVAR